MVIGFAVVAVIAPAALSIVVLLFVPLGITFFVALLCMRVFCCCRFSITTSFIKTMAMTWGYLALALAVFLLCIYSFFTVTHDWEIFERSLEKRDFFSYQFYNKDAPESFLIKNHSF
jgi:hypothetical protein